MLLRSIRVRAHWVVYTSVMALALGAFVAAWLDRQERLWGGMQDTAREAAREVGLSTRQARDNVYMLQGVANGLFQLDGLKLTKAHRDALAERLDLPGTLVMLPGAKEAHHRARGAAQNQSDTPAFSMVTPGGRKPEAGSDTAREIEIALALGPALIRAKLSQPGATAVYYLSGQGFHLVFPPSADEQQLFTPQMLERAAYRSGMVALNPGRTPAWSRAYDDPKGHGLITTLSIPIDDAEGQYRGVAAMDLQLDSLSQYVRRPGLGIATAFIIDGHDNVIAHRTLLGGASDHSPTLTEVAMQAGASAWADWHALLTVPANNRLDLGRERALVYDIESVPWRYAMVVDRQALGWAALRSMQLEALGLLVLVALLAYAEVRRRDGLVALRRKTAEDVLQAAPAPVAVLRQADLSIVVANQALTRLFSASGEPSGGPAAADGRVISDGSTEVVECAHRQLRELMGTLAQQPLRDVDVVMAQPLHRVDGSPLWVLVRCVSMVHEDQPAWLCSLTDVSALKQARDQLETLATTDPLTGALNRRAVGERGQAELRRARRGHAGFAALLLDIDHFKCVNDTHGHPAGDRVLQAVAAACQSALREVDVFGRWGGEEFIALLPDSDLGGALVVGERMRLAVEALRLEVGNHDQVRPTVSVGASVWQPGDEVLESVLSRSDAALYDAKHGGRNRVCSSPPLVVPLPPQPSTRELANAA